MPHDPSLSPELLDQAEAILTGILGRPPAAQAAALAEACAAHPDLATVLEEGYRALHGLDFGATATEAIGPYRVEQVLGEGGMGTVYLAVADAPTRRVALKVIRRGVDTRQVLRRFRVEQQAMAAMDHEAIAKVLDCDETAQGQPYFVMEYVAGLPLTRFCRDHDLDLEARLEVFLRICAGVQHAHQRGILHRDLKPGNILVAGDAGEWSVKIIDFGLARATGRSMLDETAFTQQGVLLGTPEYMSPEQAGGDVDALDTRTDVYSLGVILYELLTGELPFSSQDLRGAGLLEIQRRIRELEPPRPSTRLQSTIATAPAGTSAGRALLRALRSDLDWVILAAMAKDPERRYDSASALARDLRRYLRGEPVRVGPPSTAYLLRKFVRRNRGKLAGAAVVVVALVASIGASWFTAAEAQAQTRRADASREQADAAAAALRARNDEFEMLAVSQQLQHLLARSGGLHPAWPPMIPRLEAWLADADALQRVVPAIRTTIAGLETRRTRAPRRQSRRPGVTEEELAQFRAEVRSKQAAARVRRGEAAIEVPALPPECRTMDSGQLSALLHPLVNWDRDVYGREREGLALALRAREICAVEDRAVNALNLGCAWFANGDDDKARAALEEAARLASPANERAFRMTLQIFEKQVERLRSAEYETHLAALAEQLARLQVERSATEDRFADGADAFLYATLTDIMRRLGQLEAAVRDVRERLLWARALEAMRARDAAAWERARTALREDAARGGPYAAHPIDLVPQVGLVPIGPNPEGLWEFYDLRTAWLANVNTAPLDLEVPAPGQTTGSALERSEGVVFVLVPGGTYRIGEDGLALSPTGLPWSHEVTLAPFLLSKYEMTQRQWAALSDGRPSLHQRGNRHPVEGVSWVDCRDLLWQDWMTLPTEAQWEVAARAGRATPWWTGPTAASLAEGGVAENLLDRAYVRNGNVLPVRDEDWETRDDGYDLHAPVGSFRPNPWGFFDVLGNVGEWCADELLPYLTPPRAGDGLRAGPHWPVDRRVTRGGWFGSPARIAVVHLRRGEPGAVRNHDQGVRPARRLAGPGEEGAW